MSYLVYVEHNAENHRFFLWYRELRPPLRGIARKGEGSFSGIVPVSTEVSDLSKGTEMKRKIRRPEGKLLPP
jgi:hypothetical protein